ncbi:MAG: hypothetical protein ACXIVE_06910 [Salinarimonas sp.]
MNVKFLPAIAAALMIGATPIAMADEAPGTAPQEGQETLVDETEATPGPTAAPGVAGEEQPIATEDDPAALVEDPEDVDPDEPIADEGDIRDEPPAGQTQD